MKANLSVQDWAARGRRAGIFPTISDWRWFFDQAMLWMGLLLAVSGVVFFFAYKWADLHRFAKFALVQAPLIGVLIALYRFDSQQFAGKALMLAAAILVGALLALIGQTYRTGADTYELFSAWALLILPWVLIARFDGLWILWLLLLNMAASLYYQTFGGFFGLFFDSQRLLWTAFALNTTALVCWEVAVAFGVTWLGKTWAPRLLVSASGGLATALAVFSVIDFSAAAFVCWLTWLACACFYYRHVRLDIFVLAGGVLSVVTVVAMLLTRALLDAGFEAGGLLVIGLVVIGLSAAGGAWLKRIAIEQSQ